MNIKISVVSILMLLGSTVFAAPKNTGVCEMALKQPQQLIDIAIARVLMINAVMQSSASGDEAYDDQMMQNLSDNYTPQQQVDFLERLNKSMDFESFMSLVLDSHSEHKRFLTGEKLVRQIFSDVRAEVCSERTAGVCDPNLQRCKWVPYETKGKRIL